MKMFIREELEKLEDYGVEKMLIRLKGVSERKLGDYKEEAQKFCVKPKEELVVSDKNSLIDYVMYYNELVNVELNLFSQKCDLK